MKRHIKRKHGGGEAIKRHSGGNLEIKLQQINRMTKEYGGRPYWTLHCAFSEKRVPKMFNFELLFTHGFSLKNCEISAFKHIR